MASSSAVAIREGLMGKHSKVVNPVLTAQELADLPGCVDSDDMGTKNYTFTIFVPVDAIVPPKHESHFPCPIKRLLRWLKYILQGDSIMYYVEHLTALLDAEPIRRANKIRWAMAEAQIAPKAKHMLAISATFMTYFHTRKLVSHAQWPEQMLSVGAQSKFSFFMLGTPEGDENYANRKRLSRLIVEYLMTTWKEDGLIESEWHAFYISKHITGEDKQDDYADCMLQGVTEVFYRLQYNPTWPALNKLYKWIQRDSHFEGPGPNNWPLAFNAESEAALLSAMKKVDKGLLKAMKNLEKQIKHLAGLKRKKSPAEEEAQIKAARAEVERAQKASESIYSGLATCISMIGNRAHNKALRKIERTKELEEAERRLKRYKDYMKEAKAAGIHISEKEKQRLRGEKPQYLMELEHQAISREDALRRAYISAETGGDDDEFEFEEPPASQQDNLREMMMKRQKANPVEAKV
jgi:hypothetical protein